MPDMPKFDIPDTMREMAERNVEQARGAYDQFMTIARQAQEMVVKSSGAMAESTREIQDRTLRYAKENVDASFNLAADLAKARDIKDYMEIQARYAERQVKAFTDQAQELGRIISDMAQKSQKR